MIIRRGSQFLKHQLLQRITAQPQPPVLGLQGKLHMSFDLQIMNVGCRTKEKKKVSVQEVNYYNYNVLVTDKYCLAHNG